MTLRITSRTQLDEKRRKILFLLALNGERDSSRSENDATSRFPNCNYRMAFGKSKFSLPFRKMQSSKTEVIVAFSSRLLRLSDYRRRKKTFHHNFHAENRRCRWHGYLVRISSSAAPNRRSFFLSHSPHSRAQRRGRNFFPPRNSFSLPTNSRKVSGERSLSVARGISASATVPGDLSPALRSSAFPALFHPADSAPSPGNVI